MLYWLAIWHTSCAEFLIKNLYRISNYSFQCGDIFSSAVVVARNIEEARDTHPTGGVMHWSVLMGATGWASRREEVIVLYLGPCVCESFEIGDAICTSRFV